MIMNFLTGEWNHLLAAVPPALWFWLWVGAYALGGIVLLWVLSLVKNVAGWPGVVAVLVAVAYAFGFGRAAMGRPLNPLDNPPPSFRPPNHPKK